MFIGNKYALVAQGIVVGDDVSFYDCEGVNGVNFGSARIGGSFSFFEKMERGDSTNLKLAGAARSVRGRVSLEGAVISDDCKLVFNKNKGPSLKLERAEVSGMLAIAASSTNERKGEAIICNGDESYKEILTDSRKREREYIKRAAGDIKAWDAFEFPDRLDGQALEAYLEGPKVDGEGPKINDNVPNPPMIDLANAKAGYLHHPPAAWPQMGRLKVMGFHYQRALRYGPLAPHPFAKGNVGQSRLEVAGSSLVTLGLFGVSIGGISYCWNHAWGVGPWEAWALAACFTVSWIYRCLNVGIFGLRRTAANSPMAIAWLRLQTVERNAYKLPRWYGRWRGHIYHSLEPYAVAAAALREEGRWVSANLVEEESLKVREKQLSWRLSPGQKLLDRSVALVNCYGFSLERPAFLTAILLLFGAVLAHDAASNCAIMPKADATIGCQPYCTWELLQKSNCDTMSSGFRPSLYAIEKVLPGVDLNQEDYWTLSKNATPFKGKSLWTYEVIFSLLHMLGLGVFGLLAVAVTTRLGLTFKRYNG